MRIISKSPSQEQLMSLMKYYQSGQSNEAEKLARFINQEFPKHPFAWKVLGAVLGQNRRYAEALSVNQTLVMLSPEDAAAHYNLGIILKELGRLKESEASYRKAISLNSGYAEAYNNLGVILQELGKLEEARTSFIQAIKFKPDHADAFWNLSSCEKNIKNSEQWIDQCLLADKNHWKARLTKAALSFYQGKKSDFENLMQTELKKTGYMRSYSWAFNLPNLPELHFGKWYFFDSVIKKSIVSRPFYEFGVWRASSFKYLINTFKKGYGFDTFTGLPEDWDVVSHIEKKGNYSSDGITPKIKGGEFIVGKFEDTLPEFFSKKRPLASLINFDADLYSSTICALNFSKQVIDKNTVLVFDEFLMNDSWEQDEFKALNESCYINNCEYKVVAISFFTKQVAVKLINI